MTAGLGGLMFKVGQVLIITGNVKRKGDLVTYLRPSVHGKVWVLDTKKRELVFYASQLTPIEPDHRSVMYSPPNASIL